MLECTSVIEGPLIMPYRFACRIAGMILLLAPGMQVSATEATSTARGTTMSQAKGTFDVKVTPLPAEAAAPVTGVGRMALDKHFHGALEAHSVGEMLYAGDGGTSGAYVAIETVTGSLDGRQGSFVLVHHSLMNQGKPEAWTVTVVPDSGTGELAGLAGSMTIRIADGKHDYDFRYALDGKAGSTGD